MKFKRVGLLALSLLLLISTISCEKVRTEYSDSFFGAFDTIINVTAYSKNQSDFDKFKDEVESQTLEYSQLYDKYTEFEGINNIKTINQNAGIKPVKVDQRIIELLEYSLKTNEFYEGKVSVVFGSVLDVWHNYREDSINKGIAKLPTKEELEIANKYTNIENLEINKEESTVFLKDKNPSLDVGAVAKGYAVEKIADNLVEQGYSDFLINAGGNVKAVGSPVRENGKWGIGIQNPAAIKDETEENLLEVVYANDISVVTSGVYQRYFTVDGKDYHHIIDTETLNPGEYYQSVTIICEDSALCDYLSTDIFLKEPTKAMEMINSIEEAEGIFVLANGEVVYSSGVAKYVEE